MKNFKKALAILTAVSSFAASSSAFAAVSVSDSSFASYANGKLSVIVPTGVKSGTEMTLVVLKEGAEVAKTDNDGQPTGEYTYTVTDSNILYIDQQTQGTTGAFQGMGMKDANFESTTTSGNGHIVRLGYYDDAGEFQIAKAYVTVGSDAKTVKMVYGNIDCDAETKLNAADCIAVLRATVDTDKVFGATTTFDGFKLGQSYKTTDGITFTYGNVDCDSETKLNASDCIAILRATVDTSATFGATTTFDGFKLGQSYDVVVE